MDKPIILLFWFSEGVLINLDTEMSTSYKIQQSSRKQFRAVAKNVKDGK